ncbi:MAG: hypothetical protein ISQ70_01015 [Pirellulales bacterium]|nr:hypothetical protein [Pirellulales bacterium]
MTFASLLLAATDVTRQRLTSGRLEGFTEWWQGPLTMLVVVGVGAVAVWLYRRDAAELSPRRAAGLALLRVAAMLCLLAAWLDFERRTEHELIFPSRVAVLIDSSASMALPEGVSADGVDGDPTASPTRFARAMQLLEADGLLEALSETHEVAVWRFDAGAEPLAVVPHRERSPEGGASKRLGQQADRETPNLEGESTAADEAGPAAEPWQKRLTPSGFETRLGEALLRVADREPLDVLAGVIVLTDGATNAGVDPRVAAAELGEAGVPIVPLGLGSEALPANIRVADVAAPSRVFPDDRFAVSASLQQQGFGGATVRCELLEIEREEEAVQGGRLIDAIDVRLADEGELAAVRFDVPGLTTPGRRSLAVRVTPQAATSREDNARDNAQVTEVEVVDRVTEVLLMADGPTREYQFMRNVLKRDESFAVDVLLSTAREGSSQDARAILQAFPQTPEELDRYDVIVAFDYDWRELDALELARLERWVERESGGLVLVAGPVSMEGWLAAANTEVIRKLSPVELRNQPRLLLDAPASREEPMPLDFTPDGLDAEFLWLGESRLASQAMWGEFPGVYACYDASEAKPGGTVYARVQQSSGGLGNSGRGPIFLAGQFYGSGTVLSLGSGELWRLRAIEIAAFERLTTQLVRHVSQGRLLRGSRQIQLLVDRDRYALGATVELRVVLQEETAAGAQPRCELVSPNGERQLVRLTTDPVRPGELRGSFVASLEGSWRIEAALPGPSDDTAVPPVASRRIVVRLPDRELKSPKLDRGSLEQVAGVTGGSARFPSLQPWTSRDTRAVVESLQDRSRHEFQSGAIDTAFKQTLHFGLLIAGVGLLCTEWILRRLARLA